MRPSSNGGSFAYMASRGPGLVPRWIRPVQWALLVLWAAATLWILVGRGLDLATYTLSVMNGVYAREVAIESVLLPNWALLTVSLAALQAVLQVLWRRCRISVRPLPPAWEWTGRSGPLAPELMVRTLGGAWFRDSGRWRFVARGYLDAEGRDWLGVHPELPRRRLHPLVTASPPLVFLLLFLGAAHAVQAPYRAYKAAQRGLYQARFSGDAGVLDAYALAHPEFRPFVRYMEALPACAEPACLRRQIAARLEMRNIGPFFRADDATLFNLLFLTGRGELAVRLAGPDSSAALRQAVRRGDRREARRVADGLAARGRLPGTSEYGLLLLMEGRYGEAYESARVIESRTGHRSASIRSAAAFLEGDCARAREAAFWLLHPADQETANLRGEAGATGLGTLQRVSEKVRVEVSFALGLIIVGDAVGASASWARARDMAAAGGIPGLLDQDEQIVRLLNPGVLSGSNTARSQDSGAAEQPRAGAVY